MAEHGRIHFGTIIDAPASRVWPLLRDFRWTFMKMPETTVALKGKGEPGTIRNMNRKGRFDFDQVLVRLDDESFTLVYSNVQQGRFLGSPFDVEWNDFMAVVRLYDITDENRTFLRWDVTFDTTTGGKDKISQFTAGIQKEITSQLKTYVREHPEMTGEERGRTGTRPTAAEEMQRLPQQQQQQRAVPQRG